MKHAWDAGGNLAQRDTRLAGSQSWETENFSYDSLDRLASVSGAYTDNWTYSQNGNINTHNGTSYSYGDPAHKHAVTSNGTASYSYDGNGNMLTRGSANIIWDAENRPISVTTGNITTTIVYDGDGNRVKKTEGGQTTLYVNKYYEKLVPYSDTGNLTAGNVTTHYYLGDKQVAIRTDNTTSYVLQDHLSGTSLITDSNGNSTGTVSYAPFGNVRLGSGTIPTDKKFTGQRLDSTGLYYYGARYYDPEIGRFISPDSVVPDLRNPQAFNRYSYVLNNPLGYTDPTGHGWWSVVTDVASIAFDAYQMYKDPSWANAGFLVLDVAFTLAPVVPAGVGPIAKGVAKGAEFVEDAKKVERVVEEAAKAAEGAKLMEKAAKEALESEGIVCLRTDIKTGGQYIGQTKNEGRYLERQVEHSRMNPEAQYEFEELGRAEHGRDLDILEQTKINEYGGPARYGGPLENKRNEISPDFWGELGIPPVDDWLAWFW